MLKINTVTGTCTPEELGTTLVHEHLLIAWSGWEADSIVVKGFKRTEALKFCVDRLQELKAHGVNTFMDPCPSDPGRDVEFMAEASVKSGLRVICATGLYKEDLGGAYFKFYMHMGTGVNEIAELYEKELTEGIGDTGVKAGFIKCATGAPITTHTDEAMLGLEQLESSRAKGSIHGGSSLVTPGTRQIYSTTYRLWTKERTSGAIVSASISSFRKSCGWRQ
jgi:phosphotriesterase-related protein